jgi:hypothetical protein
MEMNLDRDENSTKSTSGVYMGIKLEINVTGVMDLMR